MKLTVTDLTKRYPKKIALKSVSLTLTEGIYALLGPNGAGKTTLMRLIADILLPTEGTIAWDDTPIGKLGKTYRSVLGFLPQDPGYYPHFTGEEMLLYFAALKGVPHAKQECEKLLYLVNLYDDRKRKVGGYSGGMKHRLGIAVALLGDPKLLLLDEPTAGLDPKERIRFRNLIAQIAADRIVLYSTHIISDIAGIANQVILIKSGEICKISDSGMLCDELNGKVYTVTLPLAEAVRVPQEQVTAFSVQNGQAALRILADVLPHTAATLAQPTLEDVYLYYFGGEEEHDGSL